MAVFKLLHLWSSWEATGGKKKNKKKSVDEIFMGFTVCKIGKKKK